MNRTESIQTDRTGTAAVLRITWLLTAALVVGIIVLATPLRYQMLQADVYGYGAGLRALGLSLPFFAAYFTGWELFLCGSALTVAALIAWKRPDDWFAVLVAVSLTLLCLQPPLADGLSYANPAWMVPIGILRVVTVTCFMALLCLFPNGRFVPGWTRWLLTLAIGFSAVVLAVAPTVMSDTAVLPNVRTLADADWLLIGTAWFVPAIGGQIVRYRRYATPLEKQQSKWVLLGVSLLFLFSLCIALLLGTFPALTANPALWTAFTLVAGAVYLALAAVLPATIALSILRFRLWDVDLFLNRTLVYGSLTVLITAVYALLAVSAGLLVTGRQSFLAAFVLATGVAVAIARPLHRRLQARANRIMPVLENAPVAAVPKTRTGGRLSAARLAWAAHLGLAIVLAAVGTTVLVQEGVWQLDQLLGAVADVVFLQLSTGNMRLSQAGLLVPFGLVYLQAVVFVGMGLLLFWRHGREPVVILASWMLIAIGIGFTPGVVLLPFLSPAWQVPVSLFQAGLFGSTVLFTLVFPDGRFYPRWTRAVAVVWLVYVALWLPFPQLNPHQTSALWPLAVWVGGMWIGVLAQFIRYRRIASEMERLQAKWVLAGFVTANLGLLLVILLGAFHRVSAASGLLSGAATLITAIAGLLPICIPLSIGVALFRYRLWNIDFLVNRSLVYGGLVALITAVYALIVGSVGTFLQLESNLLVALLATGLIAVLFQPVRNRMQRAVNRLMFGERDDPYAVLSRLSRQLQTPTNPDALLTSVVETLADTLKLPYVAIDLVDDNGRFTAARTGRTHGATVELPLRYQNELVGYLVVTSRSPGESFTQREKTLLADIAAQTGATAYAVRLTAVLRRSRENLVLAREEERRRIRRDLHDELGPTLASQTLSLDAALDLLESDPAAASDLLRDLKTQSQAVVADIRRIVYALRPPALDELGVAGALGAHAAQVDGRADVRISVTAVPDPLPALPAAVEVAAYRIALEAVNNVVRHARATQCQVRLDVVDSDRRLLRVVVADDGRGLALEAPAGVGIASMRARAEELGGGLTIADGVRGGTVVTAVLPLATAATGVNDA